LTDVNVNDERRAFLSVLLKLDQAAQTHVRRRDEALHALRRDLALELRDAMGEVPGAIWPFWIDALLRGSAARTNQDMTGCLVAAARAVGLSWEKIGESIGVSRQAAHQRFADWEGAYRELFEPLADSAAQSHLGLSPDERRRRVRDLLGGAPFPVWEDS